MGQQPAIFIGKPDLRANSQLDWIQDSILERNRRLRSERNISSVMRGPGGAVTLPWLWAQIRKIASAGQSWFVVSLVGKLSSSFFPLPTIDPTLIRYYDRSQRSFNIYNHSMALRPEDGILFGRMVVKSTILLLGNRWRR
jgi:hypothetical protein